MGNKTKIFILYLAVLALMILTACNPIKKAERRVLNDKASSERVFRELEKTHPCANDTSFVSIFDTIYKIDTAVDYKIDTINNVITLKEVGKTIYKTKKIIEVKTAYIVDNRRVNILADSVRFYKLSLENKEKAYKSLSIKFWALLVVILALIAIKIFLCN
jgi:hypothetical protein